MVFGKMVLGVVVGLVGIVALLNVDSDDKRTEIRKVVFEMAKI